MSFPFMILEDDMTSDFTLKQRVLDELDWDPRVDEAHIGVTATDGAITLTGHVLNYPQKYAAIEVAKRVSGVIAVADDIEVHVPTEHRRDDSRIAELIADVIDWNVSLPMDAVKAKVSDGMVTLTGEVDWQYQRLRIEEQISHISGVRIISNRITLNAHPEPGDIKKKIESALLRNSEAEADSVEVKVSGDTVTLSGKVRAFYERELIEEAAWAAPGVRDVVDNIRIG